MKHLLSARTDKETVAMLLPNVNKWQLILTLATGQLNI